MTAVVTAIETVVEVVGEVFIVMTSNAYITVFMAVGLLGVGIGIFSRLKRAAR